MYEEKLRSCFCFLLFLLFSLRWSENRIFISDKFRAFGNAPLMLKIICKTLLILFFYNLLFLFIHSKLLFSKILLLKKKNSVNDY